MNHAVRFAVMMLATAVAAFGQSGKSPYAGQEKRQIKALSEAEVQAYLDGEGMGLAKAAEFNRHPGPKHVLEMADQLQLSEKQKSETQNVYDRMHARATRLGKLILGRESELDSLFAGKSIDSRKLRAVTAEIARLQGRLRTAHLGAHVEMKRVLTPQQIAKYVILRGYEPSDQHDLHKGHRK